MRINDLRLTPKILLALCAMCLGIVLAQAIALRVSFNRGFHQYVRGLEAQRVESLAERLTTYYSEHGTWVSLRNNDRLWWGLSGEFDRNSKVTRYTLYDATGNVVVGSVLQSPFAISRNIESEGRVVGILKGAPLERIASAADEHYYAHQERALWWIACVSILFGLAAAYYLATTMASPLLQLSAAAHQLSSGKYDARIDLQRKDELGQLAHDFNDLASKLEKNENSRRQFMADISHEIRTPLAVLRGELESLEDGLTEPTPQLVQSLLHEVALLTRLADDMGQLAFAEVGTHTFHWERTDLAVTIPEACAAWSDRLRDHGMRLVLDVPVAGSAMMRGDSTRITQLVSNLLENCLRYARSGELVQIKLEAAAEELRLSVRDHGPGVSDSALEYLFERFYREDASRNRATGGSGLGLAICKKIAEAHGASIEARNHEEGGLMISVTFPREGQIQVERFQHA